MTGLLHSQYNEGLSDDSLVGFFPVIMNHLFHILTWSEVKEMKITTLTIITKLITRLRNIRYIDPDIILKHYHENVFYKKQFKSASPNVQELNTHSSLLQALVDIL